MSHRVGLWMFRGCAISSSLGAPFYMYHIISFYGNIFLFFDGGVGACAMGKMASPGLSQNVQKFVVLSCCIGREI